jgi:hypothetical protein
VAALRAWERRYGVVHPARTQSGYRLYDDEAIARLRAMRQLTRNGWSARLAAEEVIAHGPEAAAGLAIGDEQGSESGASVDGGNSDVLSARFVAAARSLDVAALDRVLDEMFIRGSFEQVMDSQVFPALKALGDAWSRAEISVAAEHAASHAVVRRLAAAFDAAGRQQDQSRAVIVGLPPNSRHEIGALAFATACRRAGVPVTYLGADLPIDDWRVAASNARAAVIGVATDADRKQAIAVADSLRAGYPALDIWLGGSAAAGLPSDKSRVQSLPDDLRGAIEMLVAVISPRRGAAATATRAR